MRELPLARFSGSSVEVERQLLQQKLPSRSSGSPSACHSFAT